MIHRIVEAFTTPYLQMTAIDGLIVSAVCTAVVATLLGIYVAYLRWDEAKFKADLRKTSENRLKIS